MSDDLLSLDGLFTLLMSLHLHFSIPSLSYICIRGFTQAGNLCSPQAIHSGKQQLCSICGKAYHCLKNHVIRRYVHCLLNFLPQAALPPASTVGKSSLINQSLGFTCEATRVRSRPTVMSGDKQPFEGSPCYTQSNKKRYHWMLCTTSFLW